MDKQITYSGHIAIIGMAGRFPGAGNIEQFWRNICEGKEALRRYTPAETKASIEQHDYLSIPLLEKQVASGNWVAAGYHLEDADKFDAGFFGYSPNDAELIDPQQRLFLESSWAALEDAGYVPDQYPGAVGVFGGTGLSRYFLNNVFANRDIMLASERDLTAGIGNEPDYLTNRVAYKLNLTGPSVTVQTACSTSLVAIHLACQSLRAGECDLALGGGSLAVVPGSIGYQYQEGSMNSADARIRAFDAKASGTVFSEGGVGVVVLKRLEDALQDDDHIYAVVRGSAVTNDGSKKAGYTAPGIDGQVDVVRRALSAAGTRADEVTYVEAHGTGTALGDPIEITALTTAYRAQTDKQGYCAIGSVKTNVGHLAPAAGVASVIKAALAAYHHQLPPSLNYETPNPRIDFVTGPFRVVTELSPWTVESGSRVAAVSSFGIGGTNAHLVLQEPPAREQTRSGDKLRTFVLSAKTAGALGRSAAQLAAHLRAHAELDLDDVALTLQEGRKEFGMRAAVATDARAVLLDRLDAIAAKPQERASLPATRRLAFMFTGQGAQYAGMARDLYAGGEEFRQQLDRCCEEFARHLQVDLKELLLAEHGDVLKNDVLRQTEMAQPALFAVEYALACQLVAWDIQPAALIGHSLGEYVAATLAGVFALEDAIALVALRGRLMQAMEPGSMVSLPMPLEDVKHYLSDDVQLAAVNSPRACVVAGTHQAMQQLTERLEAEGKGFRRLQTSHAFHSSMMRPLAEEFRAAVAKVERAAPSLPVMSNLSGNWLTAEQACDPEYWVQHLLSPVMFNAGLQRMLDDDHGFLLEVGPGGVLTAFARHSLGGADGQQRAATVAAMPHPTDGGNAWIYLRQAVGDLWVAGYPLNFGDVEADNIGHRISLPTYPFARERHWLEAPKAPADDLSGLLHRSEDVGDWFNAVSWRRQPWVRQSLNVEGSKVLLMHQDTPTGHAAGAAIGEVLLSRGASVVRVMPGAGYEDDGHGHFRFDTTDAGNWERWVAQAGRPLYILDALLLDTTGGETLDNQAQTRRHAFLTPLAMVQGVSDEAGSDRMTWLTVGTELFDVMPGEPLDAVKATACGPHLSVGHEYSKLVSRLLDVPASLLARPQQLAACVTDELARLAEMPHAPLILGEKMAAWRGGMRWVAAAESAHLDAVGDAPRFDGLQGPVLITGGMGGIGLSFARALVQRGAKHLVLVGRKALPAQAGWNDWLASHAAEDGTSARIRAVQALQAMGARVDTEGCDITSEQDVQAMAARVLGQHGAVAGVIHAAGVAGAGVMAMKTAQAANSVLDPKIVGALALDQALAGQPLEFFVLVSSLFAVIGGTGQVDYSGANAFLDAFARSRAAQGRKFVSLAYGGWREVGMAVAMGHTAAPPALPAGRTQQHPFLFDRSGDAAITRFGMQLRVADLWALQEHRIGGQPVMPGTGLIEAIRAAWSVMTGEPVCALGDLYFNRPLMVAEDAVVPVQIEFVAKGDHWDVSVDDEQGPVLTAEVRRAAVGSSEVVDLDALRAATAGEVVELGGKAAIVGEDGFLSLGDRWQVVQTMRFGQETMLGELALPDGFRGDLQDFGLHPALLDMATGPITGHLLQRMDLGLEDEYLPWRYGHMQMHEALPQRFLTSVQFKGVSGDKETIGFDITLLSLDGRPLVTIRDFMLKRVPKGALGQGGRPGADLAGLVDDGSISPQEGCDALLRVLAHGAGMPHWVFNPHPIDGLTRRMRSERIAQAGREQAKKNKMVRTDVVVTPPSNEEEAILVGIIEGALGITPVGIHDNFFDLGIDSVIGIQIVAHAKKHGLILKPNQLFEHQNVAALAKVATRAGQDQPATPSAAVQQLPAVDAADLSDVLGALGGN